MTVPIVIALLFVTYIALAAYNQDDIRRPVAAICLLALFASPSMAQGDHDLWKLNAVNVKRIKNGLGLLLPPPPSVRAQMQAAADASARNCVSHGKSGHWGTCLQGTAEGTGFSLGADPWGRYHHSCFNTQGDFTTSHRYAAVGAYTNGNTTGYGISLDTNARSSPASGRQVVNNTARPRRIGLVRRIFGRN